LENVPAEKSKRSGDENEERKIDLGRQTLTSKE